MDMIERVARALWDAQSTKPGTWDVLHPSKQEGMRDRARAAISAMREPTKAMVITGDNHTKCSDKCGNRSGWHAWVSMIDAALSTRP